MHERYDSRNTISDYFKQRSNSGNPEHKNGDQNPKGFVVRGAPWEQPARNGGQQVPDSADTQDFPSLGVASNGSDKQGSAAWGAWGRN